MKACSTGVLLVGLAVAGCSGSSGLTTSALLGDSGAKTEQVAAPAPVVTPTDRALQVSATSARAERCGFFFDPKRLRTSFFAAEAQNGLGAPEMQKIEREYDTIHTKLAAVIAEDKGFCTEAKTREIKKDLNRHLAGDFSPTLKKAAPTGSWFEDQQNAPTQREVINRDYLSDPTAPKTKRVDY